MKRIPAMKTTVLAVLALSPLALAAVPASDTPHTVHHGRLSEAEQALARQLAERELLRPEHGIRQGEKLYFTRLQMLPGSRAETTPREAVVTYYRYAGNQAILCTVDLAGRRVAAVEKVTNLPTPLADEEFHLAVSLARADDRLAGLFREFAGRLHVEGKLAWPANVADPAQPHRDVHLFFRVGRDYLNGPRVVVDLFRQTVEVEATAEPSF